MLLTLLTATMSALIISSYCMLSWWIERIHVKAAVVAPAMPGGHTMHVGHLVSNHGHGEVVGWDRRS